MKKQILVTSHCFLNDGAKLKNQEPIDYQKERSAKRDFLIQILSDEIELIQLPCPEFLLYGANRWGHSSSQFDTAYFRKASREMLEPILLQLEEYHAYPNRFELLGILGIDGSPSCGVNYTYDGNWGGDFSGNLDLSSTLNTLKQEQKSGVFMDVLREMLHERHLPIPLYTLDTFPYQLKKRLNPI